MPKPYGSLHPTDQIPIPPDLVQTLVLAGGAGQAFDWPNSTGGSAAEASSAPCSIVRFIGQSTAGAFLGFTLNLFSTGAALGASGTSFSSGVSIFVNGEATFQIPGHSTGWSAIAGSSGVVRAEIWKK